MTETQWADGMGRSREVGERADDEWKGEGRDLAIILGAMAGSVCVLVAVVGFLVYRHQRRRAKSGGPGRLATSAAATSSGMDSAVVPAAASPASAVGPRLLCRQGALRCRVAERQDGADGEDDGGGGGGGELGGDAHGEKDGGGGGRELGQLAGGLHLGRRRRPSPPLPLPAHLSFSSQPFIPTSQPSSSSTPNAIIQASHLSNTSPLCNMPTITLLKTVQARLVFINEALTRGLCYQS